MFAYVAAGKRLRYERIERLHSNRQEIIEPACASHHVTVAAQQQIVKRHSELITSYKTKMGKTAIKQEDTARRIAL